MQDVIILVCYVTVILIESVSFSLQLDATFSVTLLGVTVTVIGC